MKNDFLKIKRERDSSDSFDEELNNQNEIQKIEEENKKNENKEKEGNNIEKKIYQKKKNL